MNLGIVADEIDRDFAAAGRIGAPLGIRRYEVRFLTTGRAPLCKPEELREVEHIAAGEGVDITALSPGLFKYVEDATAFAHDLNEVYPKAADLAHRWNLPGLIVFGFHKPGATEQNAGALTHIPVPGQVIDWLAQAAARAASDGLLLMIEPEPICWADTATTAAAMIDGSQALSLRINHDPGNVAWFRGRDPIDDFAAASRFIANYHVKDLKPFEPGVRPQFVPAGEGIVDYRRHFAALRDSGYAGPISLEPHMDGRPETIRRCIQAFEEAWFSAPSPIATC
jgi:sugar phosphate isomerase/epimerase